MEDGGRGSRCCPRRLDLFWSNPLSEIVGRDEAPRTDGQLRQATGDDRTEIQDSRTEEDAENECRRDQLGESAVGSSSLIRNRQVGPLRRRREKRKSREKKKEGARLGAILV